MIDLYDLRFEALAAWLAELQQPAYRARQLWEWLYVKLVDDFAVMNNLPLTLRRILAEQATVTRLNPVVKLDSSDGQTRKYLFRLADGQLIETVLMRYEKRRTLCISTQAGCAMGCVFCATGQMGFMRHLRVGEIVSQVLTLARELAATDERVSNIVLMGMGEPLHNYDNTLQAIDCLTDANGLNLGARRITISTVGLVPAIRRYADEQRQTPLAVSLHAATDAERDALIPVNRRWPLAELMDACWYYVNKTGRRLTIEWALIEEENDTPEQAEALGRLVQGLLCHVNLIPLNPTTQYGGRPSSRRRVAAFQEVLNRYGVSSTVRVRRGIDIQAGCGQLRDRVLEEMNRVDPLLLQEEE
jgi:23S rRNA (adenine2503-C2)-methyltransferase